MGEGINLSAGKEKAGNAAVTYESVLEHVGIPRYSLTEFKKAGWILIIKLKKGGFVYGTLESLDSWTISIRTVPDRDHFGISLSEIAMKNGKPAIEKTKSLSEKQAKAAEKDYEKRAKAESDEKNEEKERIRKDEEKRAKAERRKNNPTRTQKAVDKGKAVAKEVKKKVQKAVGIETEDDIKAREEAERAEQLAKDKETVKQIIKDLNKALGGSTVANDNEQDLQDAA